MVATQAEVPPRTGPVARFANDAEKCDRDESCVTLRVGGGGGYARARDRTKGMAVPVCARLASVGNGQALPSISQFRLTAPLTLEKEEFFVKPLF